MGKEHLVCKLQKAVYGLKQAGRMWYIQINECLETFGFARSAGDHSVYVSTTLPRVIIAIYVDDLILLCASLPTLNDVKQGLADRFEMKNLGELKF